MRKMPAFVRKWARAADVEPEDVQNELDDDGEWEKVSEELVEEEKYNNVTEVIYKHLDSGRFIRVWTHSLPYGITDYGMAPEGEEDIEEVFPVEVTVTKYLTREEAKK